MAKCITISASLHARLKRIVKQKHGIKYGKIRQEVETAISRHILLMEEEIAQVQG